MCVPGGKVRMIGMMCVGILTPNNKRSAKKGEKDRHTENLVVNHSTYISTVSLTLLQNKCVRFDSNISNKLCEGKMKSFTLVVGTMAVLCQSTAFAFSVGEMGEKRVSSMQMSSTSMDGDTRRDFFSKTGTAIAGIGIGVLAPSPAEAASVDKVNAKLKSYGLPLIKKVPSGFSPLLEVYGTGKNRFPLLVQFCHPSTWVVTLPSNDVNGESGTVQAGEYAKGDTATFFVYNDGGKVENVAEQPKDFFENVLIKAISQKGANIYQNFKVTKVVPQEGTNYVTCDFRYELLTGAGFEVDRRGVASITSEGGVVEALWAASTRQRYKKTEEDLREIAASFRVYSDGINFSNDLIQYDDV